MKKECEICGDKSYKEVKTSEKFITMCKKCFSSYKYWSYKWGVEP